MASSAFHQATLLKKPTLEQMQWTAGPTRDLILGRFVLAPVRRNDRFSRGTAAEEFTLLQQ